jgi:hypothetical protein
MNKQFWAGLSRMAVAINPFVRVSHRATLGDRKTAAPTFLASPTDSVVDTFCHPNAARLAAISVLV